MLDVRHETDTLFLMFEEDWRLNEDEQVSQEVLAERFLSAQVASRSLPQDLSAVDDATWRDAISSDYAERASSAPAEIPSGGLLIHIHHPYTSSRRP